MRSFAVLGLLFSLALLGCATKKDVQLVNQKVETLDKRENARWAKQVLYDQQEPDRVLKAIQGNIDSGRARDPLGGGPQSHLPNSIGGMEVVRHKNPQDSRYQWTKVWDSVTGQWVVQETLIQPVGPSAAGATTSSVLVQSQAAPATPAAPSLTAEDVKRIVREAEEEAEEEERKRERANKEVEDAAARGAERAITDLAPRFEQMLRTGTDDLADSISRSTKAEINLAKEELTRGFEAALKANAASQGCIARPSVPPAVVVKNVTYQQYVLPGCYYRVWRYPAGGCWYYQYYPYSWRP